MTVVIDSIRSFAIFACAVASSIIPTNVAGQEPVDRAVELVRIPNESSSLIQLPIRFHLVRGAVITKRDVKMDVWLTRDDLRRTVVPEINRIWRTANIQWVIESIVDDQINHLPNQSKLLGDIAQATRATPDRTSKIWQLLNMESRHPAIHNVYFFPYVGETSQGFALFGGSTEPSENPDGGSRCVVGVWTDKPSRGKEPPRRFRLREPLPFETGSVARTCAHELGHNLLLQHPNRATQTQFHRLMGGNRLGYQLTAGEVSQAREVALGRAATIRRWNRSSR